MREFATIREDEGRRHRYNACMHNKGRNPHSGPFIWNLLPDSKASTAFCGIHLGEGGVRSQGEAFVILGKPNRQDLAYVCT